MNNPSSAASRPYPELTWVALIVGWIIGCVIAVSIGYAALILGFSIGLLTVEVLQLEGIIRGVVIVESAMPVAVFNYLLAARYERHPEDVAGAIVISTLISFLTMPALIIFALG